MKLSRFPVNVYDLSRIKASKVVFIGLGSVGSQILANMTLPFRKFVLIDPKELKENNVERHLLGRDEIGNPKVDGCARYLRSRGVARSRIYSYAATHKRVLRYHQDASLVICSVDVEEVKRDVNAWCMERNIPLIVASVYAGGVGGQIIVLPKPQVSCYVCAQAELGNLEYKGVPADTDYGIDPTILRSETGDPMAVPSLAAPVDIISAYAAIKSLEILAKGGEVSSQALVIALSDWIEVRKLNAGNVLSAVTNMIVSMGPLGMLRSWKLDRLSQGFSLMMRDSIFPLMVPQWKGCTLHSTETVSEDSI